MYDYADSVPPYHREPIDYPIEEIDIDDEAAAHCFYDTLAGSTQEAIIAALVRHVVEGKPLQISDLVAMLTPEDKKHLLDAYHDEQDKKADRLAEQAEFEYRTNYRI